MIHTLVFRASMPCIVSFLGGLELAYQPYDTLSEALLALSLLKGW